MSDDQTNLLIEDAQAVLDHAADNTKPWPEAILRFALSLPFLKEQDASADNERGRLVARAISRLKDDSVFNSDFWRQVAKAAASRRESPDFQIAVASANSDKGPLTLVRLSANVPGMQGVIVEQLLDLEDTAKFCSSVLDAMTQHHQELAATARTLGSYEQAVTAIKTLKEKAQALEIPPPSDQP